TTCANTAGTAPVAGRDQRGIHRPQAARCDIGAFEFVPPVAIALVSSGNPPAAGQAVTFTATVSGTVPPTGSVAFEDGATLLGTIPLVGGVARFTTAALAAGVHTITAAYSGDAIFAPGTAAITVAVGPIVVDPLPPPRAGGGAGGAPAPLPPMRGAAGPTGGPPPNPLPPARP
ncbi:MAG: hypothetical protein DLM58_17725, partial [Pseudonocardiales bacterium]